MTDKPLSERLIEFGHIVAQAELDSEEPNAMTVCDPDHRNASSPPWQVKTPITSPPVPVPQAPPAQITLDPSDPFDAALIPIVMTNRRKRADYAKDGDPFSNFDVTSELLGLDGFGPVESALFNVGQKLARLKALRANGRMNDVANESVADTYLDLAVYAVITLALYQREVNKITGGGQGDRKK